MTVYPPPWAVLDFAEHGRPIRRVFTQPREVLRADRLDEVRPCLEAAERAALDGRHALGFVSYEAAPAFDPALTVRGGGALPLAWFAVFDEPNTPAPAKAEPPAPARWSSELSRDDYRGAIATIREAIAAGETYQLNFTLRMSARFDGDDFALYEQLREAQGAAYSAYLNLGRHRVLSASPELFFEWDGRRLRARPMKGTARRGRFETEDALCAQRLVSSEKERAENTIIVDLLRNDLSRVAEVGSVRVTRQFDVETFRTVHQMTSTIEADSRPGTRLVEVFGALFPCGSVTGAPKVRTMRLISTLERSAREVYCGALGHLAPGGRAVFNVAIRTVWLDAETKTARYGAGGGITWDSTSDDEYDEVLAKAQVLSERWPAFELVETMRLENGVYALRARHLQRLASSARYFQIPLDERSIEAALDAYADAHSQRGALRVRLLVGPEGAFRLESQPLAPRPEGALTVALASAPVSRHDRFLFHKTTHRQAYARHAAGHPDVYDVLLFNEDGELTELTRGNVVVELDGERHTPPVASGLLPGTLRAELLERGEVSERVIRVDDLERAEQLWFINSVQGWVPVTLAARSPQRRRDTPAPWGAAEARSPAAPKSPAR